MISVQCDPVPHIVDEDRKRHVHIDDSSSINDLSQEVFKTVSGGRRATLVAPLPNSKSEPPAAVYIAVQLAARVSDFFLEQSVDFAFQPWISQQADSHTESLFLHTFIC